MLPSRIRTLGTVALLAALLPACRDKAPEPPDIAEVLPNVPLPPNAQFVSRSGGEDAILITLRSSADFSDVEAYYLSVFSGPGWKLVKRSMSADSTLVLLAEQDGPPLWVRIRSTDDRSGTLVDLSGARVAQPAS